MKRAEWLLKLYWQRRAAMDRLAWQSRYAWEAGDKVRADKIERVYDRLLGQVWHWEDILRCHYNVVPMEKHF